MKNIFKIIILLLFAISLFAQNTSGTIDIDQGEDIEAKPPKETAKSKAVEYLTKINKAIETEDLTNIPDNSDSINYYLTTLYLYCSIKFGVCPEVLDAVLTHDLINSSVAKNSSCKNLKSFWKTWLANDMEKRQSYSIKIVHANESAAFKKNKRNQYIKCKDTVSQEIATPFGRKDSVAKALKIITEIDNKGIDIFSEVGLS